MALIDRLTHTTGPDTDLGDEQYRYVPVAPTPDPAVRVSAVRTRRELHEQHDAAAVAHSRSDARRRRDARDSATFDPDRLHDVATVATTVASLYGGYSVEVGHGVALKAVDDSAHADVEIGDGHLSIVWDALWRHGERQRHVLARWLDAVRAGGFDVSYCGAR